ncbi:MAG: immunity 17 family protein [Planctomycetota bacterium]|jgi:drug/metabolite transporter superfamily protein YnfA
MNLIGLFFVAAGLFATAGAIYDWDWFTNARKARFLVKALSRNGARIFYAVLGLALVLFGLLATMGIIELSE